MGVQRTTNVLLHPSSFYFSVAGVLASPRRRPQHRASDRRRQHLQRRQEDERVLRVSGSRSSSIVRQYYHSPMGQETFLSSPPGSVFKVGHVALRTRRSRRMGNFEMDGAMNVTPTATALSPSPLIPMCSFRVSFFLRPSSSLRPIAPRSIPLGQLGRQRGKKALQEGLLFNFSTFLQPTSATPLRSSERQSVLKGPGVRTSDRAVSVLP